MRSARFWGITQRRVVILYRRFGTTYRSHIQGSRRARRVEILGFLTLEGLPLDAALYPGRAQISTTKLNTSTSDTHCEASHTCVPVQAGTLPSVQADDVTTTTPHTTWAQTASQPPASANARSLSSDWILEIFSSVFNIPNIYQTSRSLVLQLQNTSDPLSKLMLVLDAIVACFPNSNLTTIFGFYCGMLILLNLTHKHKRPKHMLL
jgi:hypothetical protein